MSTAITETVRGLFRREVAPPTVERPTYDEIFDRLSEVGCTPREVEILLGLLRDLTKELGVDSDDYAFIEMDMRAHDLLDRVMPDRAVALPGSIHDALNRHFLPAGYVFEHDRLGSCVVEIHRAAA